MNNSILTSLFFFLLCLSFTSCKDKDQIPEPGIDPKAFFSCEFDGVDYISEGFYAYAADFDTHINIYGASGLDIKDAIYIALPKGFDKGTYAFDDELYGVVAIGSDSYSTRLSGGTGEVVIEKYDGVNIKGRFSFSAPSFEDPAQNLEVINGKFEVKLRD